MPLTSKKKSDPVSRAQHISNFPAFDGIFYLAHIYYHSSTHQDGSSISLQGGSCLKIFISGTARLFQSPQAKHSYAKS